VNYPIVYNVQNYPEVISAANRFRKKYRLLPRIQGLFEYQVPKGLSHEKAECTNKGT